VDGWQCGSGSGWVAVDGSATVAVDGWQCDSGSMWQWQYVAVRKVVTISEFELRANYFFFRKAQCAQQINDVNTRLLTKF
jgi:hypothetical protein